MNNFSEDKFFSAPQWFLQKSESTDVVMFAEAIAIRNVAGYSFCLAMSDDEREEVKSMLVDFLRDGDYDTTSAKSLTPMERMMFAERWTISHKTALHPGASEILINEDESESAVVCNIEHLWMRTVSTLENLSMKTKLLLQSLDSMELEHKWATHPQIGFLSPSPAACGAGISISILCHLPASIISNQFARIHSTAESYGIKFVDPWIGGFDMGNPFVQFTTSSLVGRNPDDLLADISMLAEEIIRIERLAREEMNENSIVLEDKVMRAFGLVSYAKVIEMWEFLEILSTLRLGAVMGIIDVPLHKIDEIMVLGQQAHTASMVDDGPDPLKIAQKRAEMMREKLGINEMLE